MESARAALSASIAPRDSVTAPSFCTGMRLDDVTVVRDRVVSCAAPSVTNPAASAIATVRGRDRMIRRCITSLSRSFALQLRGRLRTGRLPLSPNDGKRRCESPSESRGHASAREIVRDSCHTRQRRPNVSGTRLDGSQRYSDHDLTGRVLVAWRGRPIMAPDPSIHRPPTRFPPGRAASPPSDLEEVGRHEPSQTPHVACARPRHQRRVLSHGRGQ